MKRGQMTLFIALGLVIIVAIGFGLYFSGVISEAKQARESIEASKALEQSKDVQKFVEGCILETTKNVILEVYAKGGYFLMPEKSVVYLHYDIPIYMDDGKDNAQRKKDVEREIAIGIDARLQSCLQGFSSFENVKTSGTSDTEVSISASRVTIETYLPLIIDNEVKSRLVKFYTEYEKDILSVYDESLKVYNEVKNIKGVIPFSLIAILAEQKDYDFLSDNVGDVQVYVFRFNKTLVKETPLEYTFAVYNPLKEGERIMVGGDDLSELFGLVEPEEEDEEELTDDDLLLIIEEPPEEEPSE